MQAEQQGAAAPSEREQFEAWAKSHGTLLTKDKRGNYQYTPTSAMWKAWQAARSQPTPPAVVEPPELSPDFTDTARAALLWVLWHHQGGSSPVGQPIRFALGMGQHDRLNEHHLAEAKRWERLHPVNPSVFPRGPGCWAWGPTHWQCAVREIARLEARIQEIGKAARENRSRAVLALESEVQHLRNANMPAKCWCATCRPITLQDMRMVLCPTCGNKRCPRATSHENACTGSNEPGQKGSSYEHVRPTSGPVP